MRMGWFIVRKTLYFSVSALIVFGILFAVRTSDSNRRSVLASTGGIQDSVIILDAGHGGYDGGAVASDGTVEKVINLQIVQKLDRICRAAGLQTVLTRTDDNSIHDAQITSIRQQKISDIHNRLHIMEQTENSLFVSIHQNHFTQPRYRGTQVFYSGNLPESRSLAQSIQQAVTQSVQPENTRTVKRSGTEIYLLYHAVRPAVMVECGFLSNPQETELLKTDAYQQKLAMAICKGIIEYRENTEVV